MIGVTAELWVMVISYEYSVINGAMAADVKFVGAMLYPHRYRRYASKSAAN